MVDSICALKFCATPYWKQTNCRPTNPKVHIHLLTYYLPKQLPSSPLPLFTPSSTTATVFITTCPKGLSDHVPGYAHLPPHRWIHLYHGCARSSASGRSHMRVLPPGTLCPTTSAPWLILSRSENCLNYSILVKLLTFVDSCVSVCALASGGLL